MSTKKLELDGIGASWHWVGACQQSKGFPTIGLAILEQPRRAEK